MNKKQFISFVCFCTLALSLIFATGQLFRDKVTSMAGFYSQPDNTIDAIIVGSSHVNSGYIPAVLWEEYGISAHNVYSWSQPIWIGYHYIEEAFKTQDIKLVVVDLYGMMYGNSHEQPQEIDKVSYRNSFSIDVGLNRWKMMQTVENCGIDLQEANDFINIVRYHTAWKNIDSEMFTYDNHNDPDLFRGYGYQTEVNAITPPTVPENVQPRMPYDTAVKYLDKISAIAEKRNVDMVFVITPYQFQPEERELFAWLENYAQEKEIPLINYAQNYDSIGFDHSVDMADMSHLNYKGALKTTRNLGEFIVKNYPHLVNRQHPYAQQLDADAQKVYRVLQINETVDLNYNNYFDFIANDKDMVLFTAIAGDAKYTENFAVACEKLGITLDPDGFMGRRDEQWEQFEESFTMGDIVVTADKSSAGIKVKNKDYHGADAKIKFAIYDKILERTTFYFYYDISTDSIVIKDYPSRINGGIYD